VPQSLWETIVYAFFLGGHFNIKRSIELKPPEKKLRRF